MRMNPGPSSDRERSKCAQSTMSRASSLTCRSSSARAVPAVLPRLRDSRKRVKFALAAPIAIEGIAPAAEVQPQRNCAEIEIAPKRVDEIAAVAFGQFVGAVAEHGKARRTGVHLG